MTPEQSDVLGRAADVININPVAYEGFLEERASGPRFTYDTDAYLNLLRDHLQRGYWNNVGWWYGRITDPRRKENP